jgi:L-asparaginase
VYYRDVVKRHTAKSEFDLAGVTSLPRVDIVLVYQGAAGDLIKAAVDGGAKGIVIAAAGAGAIAPDQSIGLDYAASKGVIVVTATRTGSGRIAAGRMAPPAATGSAEAPRGPSGGPAQPQRRVWRMVAAEDLTPLKARILLMAALTRTQDVAEIQRMFTEY